MRFKKGTKVEVLNKKEVPLGAWNCGEIVSGNGHNYYVRYYLPPDATVAAVVERVSRKVLRPCPPPVQNVKDWVAGDIFEVFDNMSWKIATVSKVMGGNYFLAKLLGSSQEFSVHKTYTRVRQSWKGNEWVMNGKIAGIYEDEKSNKLSTLRYCQKLSCQVPETGRKMKLYSGDNDFLVEKNVGFQESHVLSSRTLKRGSPYGSGHPEVYTRAGKKMRESGKESRRQQMVPGHRSPSLEKVDAVAYPRNMLGEKCMHSSFYKQIGFSELDMERAKPNGDAGCFIAKSLEPNDADSSASSVGSCNSTSNIYNRLPHRSLINPSQDLDIHFSDAVSFCGGGYEKECPLPMKEDMTAEVHKLELDAYRCTMETLFASGSLSWEQQDLLTNLRLTLNISNDEHLMELRNLVSAKNNLLLS